MSWFNTPDDDCAYCETLFCKIVARLLQTAI